MARRSFAFKAGHKSGTAMTARRLVCAYWLDDAVVMSGGKNKKKEWWKRKEGHSQFRGWQQGPVIKFRQREKLSCTRLHRREASRKSVCFSKLPRRRKIRPDPGHIPRIRTHTDFLVSYGFPCIRIGFFVYIAWYCTYGFSLTERNAWSGVHTQALFRALHVIHLCILR